MILGVLLETVMGNHLALPLLCYGQLIPRHPLLGVDRALSFHLTVDCLALFTHLLRFLSPLARQAVAGT